jgi:acetyl/propionyl-CoA carboxylase alpha subunit
VGYRQGDVVSIHYDPLIAKLVTHGPDRATALRRMRTQLTATVVSGVTTNRAFMLDVLDHSAFRAGHFDTHFIPTHFEGWQPAVDSASLSRRLVAATLAEVQTNRVLPGLRTGFRNNLGAWQARDWRVGEETYRVEYTDHGDGVFKVRIGEVTHEASISKDGPAHRLRLDGLTLELRLWSAGDTRIVLDADGATELVAVPRFPQTDAEDDVGGLTTPMPGKVVSVAVEVGATVTKGQTLIILEAMKMEQSLTAPRDGVVEQVRCAAGDLVEAGAALVVLVEA